MTGSRIGIVRVLVAAAMALTPHIVFAQTASTDRGYVFVSGWFQPSASFSDVVHPIDFVEASVVETGYKTGSVPGFEAGGGARSLRQRQPG